MRLLNTRTKQLERDRHGRMPEYAILSHRWEAEEVSFEDMQDDRRDLTKLKGYSKISKLCDIAASDGYEYAWIDTCCIDKRSSAELSEAINSMFQWHRDSAMCYAYLCDIDILDDLPDSVWFTRGWTLQELVAPPTLKFYNRHWTCLSDKASLLSELKAITAIPTQALDNIRPAEYCVAEKMAWSACRVTEREEDSAYCLLGIFDINMPLMYGEGANAFWRLQETIMETSNDMSIFLWNGPACRKFGMLAHSPSCFSVDRSALDPIHLSKRFNSSHGWVQNNAGISIDLILKPYFRDEFTATVYIAVVQDSFSVLFGPAMYCIFLKTVRRRAGLTYVKRVTVDGQCTVIVSEPTVQNFLANGVATNVLLARQPIEHSSSSRRRTFTVTWDAPYHLPAQAFEAPTQNIERRFVAYDRTKSIYRFPTDWCYSPDKSNFYGAFGYLVIELSQFLTLVIWFGNDRNLVPFCVAAFWNKDDRRNDWWRKLNSKQILKALEALVPTGGKSQVGHNSIISTWALRISTNSMREETFFERSFLEVTLSFDGLRITPYCQGLDHIVKEILHKDAKDYKENFRTTFFDVSSTELTYHFDQDYLSFRSSLDNDKDDPRLQCI